MAGPGNAAIFRDRMQRAAAALKERRLDALFVFSPEDIAYFTGYYPHLPWYPADLFRLAPLILRPAAEPIQVATLVNAVRVRETSAVACVVEYNEYSEDGIEFLGALIEKEGLARGRIGYEARKVVCHTLQRLQQRCPGVEWVDVGTLLWELRARKDDVELALLREACRINRTGLEAARSCIRAGVREAEVAAQAEYAMRRSGADRFTEETMVLSGRRIFHTRDRSDPDRVIEPGFVIVDMGAVYRGYCSDMATTVFVGTPSAEQAELLRVAQEVFDRAFRWVRPGMRACDVDAFVREQYERAGLPGAHVPHIVGHGVGLEFHELPLLKPGETLVLEPGMTFCFEPAVRVPSVGAVRLEEVVVLTEDGLARL